MSLDSIRAMVLGAGFGTRLLPLTRELPKALLPVLGRPLLEWNLRFLAACEIGQVVVNAHHHADSLERWTDSSLPASFSAGSRIGSIEMPRVRVVREPEILGTAGGIGHAAPFLDSDPVLIWNVDLLFKPDLELAVEQHRDGGHLATLLCVREPRFSQIRVDGAAVREILEHPEPGDPELWAFTGVYLLAAEAVAALPRGRFAGITPLLRAWTASGRVGAVPVETAPFREVGTLESYLELHRDLAGDLREGLLFGDPPPGLQEAIGFGFIGPHARVGANARIAESVVLDGAEIAPGARVRQSILGPGARIAGVAERVAAVAGESRSLSILSSEEEAEIREVLEGDWDAPARPRLRRLAGDGSGRRIVRVTAGPRSEVLILEPAAEARAHGGDGELPIYPLRTDPGAPGPIETYRYVAEYLDELGVPTAAVLGADATRGALLLEDLGDTHLADRLRRPGTSATDRRALYEEAIEILLRMQTPGREPFDPARVANPTYDEPFIRTFEAGYFHREMVNGHAGLDVAVSTLEPEYARVAQAALEDSERVFMHRDYQSRNLMVVGSGLAVIDIQSARLGPRAYDLASLLHDPYAALDPGERESLLELYLARAGRSVPRAADRFRAAYRASAINRMLQALGAFAYLGGRLGKPGFLEHAPAALRSLRQLAGMEFPVIASLASRLEEALQTPTGPGGPTPGE